MGSIVTAAYPESQPAAALEAFDRARPPKHLVTLDCGHFDPYSGPLFEPNVAAQRDWFVEHLKP